MSPAITTSTSTTDEGTPTTCASCLGLLTEAALKCKNCTAYIHLRCSGLPEYQLVRFAVTQSAFICGNCVKTKDTDEGKYQSELTKIREIMAQEESLIEQTQREADETVNESDANLQAVNDSTSQTDAPVPPKPSTTAICKYYITRECKYGRAGKECKFNHPRICQGFSRDRDRRGGCTKGKNCQDFHPNTCWESLETKQCSRRKCRYFHLNGTKLTYEDQNLERNVVQNQTNYRQQNPRQRNSYSQMVRSNRMTDQPLRQSSQIPRLGEHPATIFPSQVSETNICHSQDFLVMDQRMQKLESMLTLIMQSVRLPAKRCSPANHFSNSR